MVKIPIIDKICYFVEKIRLFVEIVCIGANIAVTLHQEN